MRALAVFVGVPLLAAGCAAGPSPPTGGLAVAPVLVRDAGEESTVGLVAVTDLAGAVVRFFARYGVVAHVLPARAIDDAGRAAVLVDFTEAADPCGAVRSALSLRARPNEVALVVGGRINSVLALRPLYGTSCGGRAEGCASDPGHGMVLVDGASAGEIDLAVVAAHELGHVLGLRHPFEADCGGASAPEAAGNLMAIERDAPDGGDLRSLALADLRLTADQAITMRGPP